MYKKKGIDASDDMVALYLESLKNPQPEDLQILRELRKGTDPKKVLPKQFLLNRTTDGG